MNLHIKTFFKKSNINFYIFIPIVIALLVNNFMTDESLRNKIINSSAYKEINKNQKKELLHITDILTVEGTISDNENIYDLKNIAILRKTVEMYSWVKKHIGTRYSQEKEWKTYVPELTTNRYNNPVPKKKLGIFYYYPKSVHLGDINISIEHFKVDKYTNGKLKNSQRDKHDNYSYLYYGDTDLNNPRIGNIRIKYDVFESNKQSTIFVTFNEKIKFKNDTLQSLYGKDVFFTLFRGDINNVYNSFVEEESSWKFMINCFLLLILLFFIIKGFIFTFYIMIYTKMKTSFKKIKDSY